MWWGLVFQRHDGLTVAAEGCHFLQIAIGLGQCHDWAVAVNGVAAGSEVPSSAFGAMLEMADRATLRLRLWLRNRETEQQG